MSGLRVRYSIGAAHVGLDLGALKFISEHTGADRVSYVDCRFEHGLLQMTSAALGTLVRQGTAALTKLPGGDALLNCSGALARIEGDADGL
jgi:hypothetical protein